MNMYGNACGGQKRASELQLQVVVNQLHTSSLQEQRMPSTTKSSLQPCCFAFTRKKMLGAGTTKLSLFTFPFVKIRKGLGTLGHCF